MRTAFYLLITFLIATSAFADAMPSIEEVPAGKPMAKLPKSAESTFEAPISLKKESSGAAAPTVVSPSSSSVAAGTSIITAKGEKLAIATGHYARARALLIAAVREFDKGFEQVDPSALIDTGSWRNNIMDRAEDLQKILDPQPRRSQGGVRFDDATAKTGDAGALHKKK